MNKTDIYLLDNDLCIKINNKIDYQHIDQLVEKIKNITFSYKLSNIIIDSKDKSTLKNLIKKIKKVNLSYNIKTQNL